MELLKEKSIYIINKNDREYPNQLIKALGNKAPPILYCCGNIALANINTVAIIGSRNIDAETEKYAANLAKKAVYEGYAVCSGGAKGTDRASEKAAIESGGYCISFLADLMIQKISRPEIYTAVKNGKMLLLSAVEPDKYFHVSNAMLRNKYIYAMSQCAFVIAAAYNKGGTWAGAAENIKSRLSNTYIWDNPKYSGNRPLIAKGGIGIDSLEKFSVAELVSAEIKSYPEQLSLFDLN